MYRLLTLIFAGLFLTISASEMFSQSRTYSPYSRYGLGELIAPGNSWNKTMGGTGIGISANDRLNSLNPASYSAIDSMSFNIDLGISSNLQSLRSNNATQNYNDTNFDYLTFGFLLHKRVGFSIGLTPVSQAGYQFQTGDGSGDSSIQTSSGFGNISSIYGGLGYNVFGNFSIGANVSYWFGDVYHKTYVYFPYNSNSMTTGIKNEHTISTVLVHFGAQHTFNLSEDKSITIGATYSPSLKVNGESQRLVANGTAVGIENDLFADNIIISSDTIFWGDSNFKFPSKIGGGASYNIKNKLLIAADYSLSNWGSVNFPDNGITTTADASSFGAGIEWVPNERTGRRYFSRIKYRAGFNYSNEYLKINNNQLTNTNFSAGLGLPLRRSKTAINIGYSYGTRKISMPGSLKETYQTISLSIFMDEMWFFKRKIN